MADSEVNVKINLQAEGTAPAALTALAEKTERALAAEQRLNDALGQRRRHLEDLKALTSHGPALAEQVSLDREIARTRQQLTRAHQIESGRQTGGDIGAAAGGIFGAKGEAAGKKFGAMLGEMTVRGDWLTRGLRSASGGLDSLQHALLPLPDSLGALVRQSVGQSAPGGLSTLSKSLGLVLGEIGLLFLPAILHASKALQDFATILRGATPGQIPGRVLQWAGGDKETGEGGHGGALFGGLMGWRLLGKGGGILGAGLGNEFDKTPAGKRFNRGLHEAGESHSPGQGLGAILRGTEDMPWWQRGLTGAITGGGASFGNPLGALVGGVLGIAAPGMGRAAEESHVASPEEIEANRKRRQERKEKKAESESAWLRSLGEEERGVYLRYTLRHWSFGRQNKDLRSVADAGDWLKALRHDSDKPEKQFTDDALNRRFAADLAAARARDRASGDVAEPEGARDLRILNQARSALRLPRLPPAADVSIEDRLRALKREHGPLPRGRDVGATGLWAAKLHRREDRRIDLGGGMFGRALELGTRDYFEPPAGGRALPVQAQAPAPSADWTRGEGLLGRLLAFRQSGTPAAVPAPATPGAAADWTKAEGLLGKLLAGAGRAPAGLPAPPAGAGGAAGQSSGRGLFDMALSLTAGSKALPLQRPRRGGGKDGFAVDDLPPGYHAHYQSFADVRRDMQIKSLNTSSLDMKMHEQAMRGWEMLMRLLPEIAQQLKANPPEMPRDR